MMNKRFFVEELSQLLQKANMIQSVRYIEHGHEEYVQLEGRFGGRENIAVTADSNACIMKKIGAAICGEQATGAIRNPQKNAFVNKLFENTKTRKDGEFRWR